MSFGDILASSRACLTGFIDLSSKSPINCSSRVRVKRFMGRRYDEVGEEMKRIPYKVVKGEHDDARVDIFGKIYSPPQISAMILGKLKSAAEDFLGEKVGKAVITV